MDLSFFVRGLVIGLSIAAVVGPMSVLCMQRTVRSGLLYGLVSGLGIATADGIYGSIAAFGLTVISAFLVHQQLWIRLPGGLFLVYLGIKSLLTKPSERAAAASKANNFLGAYASTLLLTLTNPLTILSFAVVFAGIGLGGQQKQRRLGSACRLRSVSRLCPLVVCFDQRHQPAAWQVFANMAALDQPRIRRRDHPLRRARTAEFERMKCACTRLLWLSSHPLPS